MLMNDECFHYLGRKVQGSGSPMRHHAVQEPGVNAVGEEGVVLQAALARECVPLPVLGLGFRDGVGFWKCEGF